MVTQAVPPQPPNESEVQKALRFLLSALQSETAYHDGQQVTRRYLGRQLVREDDKTNVLPIGKTTDIVNEPDDQPKLWSSRQLREAISSENLAIIGLNEVFGQKGEAAEDDFFIIRDSSDGNAWKIVSVEDVRGLVLAGGIEIRVRGTGGITASYTPSGNEFRIDGSELLTAWTTAMRASSTTARKVQTLLGIMDDMNDAQLEIFFRAINRLS